VAVLDFHANVSPAIVANADVILAYATYPHIDTFAKGRRAVELALEIRDGRLRPERALRQVPLLLPGRHYTSLPTARPDSPSPLGANRESASVEIVPAFGRVARGGRLSSGAG
jgi:microcystin degradation protein MlrC